MAWDCATGSGQAAIGLAEQFEQVEATDASAAQLAAALAHPRVRYRQAPADASGLAPHSVELVTVAQALHWLDRPAFYAEARRVAAPPGPLAAGAAGRPGRALTLLRDVVCPPHLSDTTSLEPGARAMSKGDDRKLAALAKKNAAKAAKAKPIKRRRYDDTLPPEREEDLELRDFFSEMKKREF